MQLEECQGRIIVKVKNPSDTVTVIERAKQKFTSLLRTYDIAKETGGGIPQVWLDFPEKDANFIKVLSSDEFPEVKGAVFDVEMVLEGANRHSVPLGEEPPDWVDETGRHHISQAKLQADYNPETRESVAPFDPSTRLGNANNITPEDIANNVAIAGDDVAALASQVSPNTTAPVIPYGGSGSPIYTGVIYSSAAGPKLAFEAGGYYYPTYSLEYLLPGDNLYIIVGDASNANYKWCFSTTPDGTHNGGVEYTTNVTRVGTPGDGSQYTFLKLDIDYTTPLQLFLYEENTIGAGLSIGTTTDSSAATRSMSISLFSKWYMQRMTQVQDGLGYGSYSITADGENTDVYIIDTGVRGSSRPSDPQGANLHPELYHPDYISDLNGTTEQSNYRVYEVAGYNSGITLNGEANSNEDDDGHGTECACLTSGRTFGMAKKSRIYALKVFNDTGTATTTMSSRFAMACMAIVNHNSPSNANWKGNYRPAVVNASLGVVIPSDTYPYVHKNEPGYDTGLGTEIYDDYENWVLANGINYVRSAGNGFAGSLSNNYYDGYQGKFNAGVRSGGPRDNKYNMEMGYYSENGKIVVGATSYINTFSAFSNYGTITTSAPGENIYIPRYEWNSNTPYNYISSAYYVCTQGTSFSGPLTAGVVAQWLTKMGYLQNYTYENGKTLPQLCKEWIRRDLDWDYSRTWNNGTSDVTVSPVGYESGGPSIQTYPSNTIDEITLDGLNTYVQTAASSNIITFYLGSEYARLNATVGDKIQLRTPIGIISNDVIDSVWVSDTDGFGTDSATAGYHLEGGLFNISTDNSPWPGLFGTFPKAGTSGYVSNLTLSQQGSGYTTPPSVSFSGGGGAGATATSQITLTGGAITGINVDQAGSGYTEAPTVVLTGDGTGATATASISLTGGGIQAINITNGGAGYNPLGLPAITFTGGGGSGAAATAIVENGQVTGATITNPGVGYTVAPSIFIASASAPVNNPEYDPDPSLISGGGSVASSNLNTVSRAFTTTSDCLPQPALYGTFPNAYNSYTILPKSYNHAITYRGGRNVACPAGSETYTSATPYDFLAITKNGIIIKSWSNGTGNALPDGTSCPTGYSFNRHTYSAWWGSDAGSGRVDSTGLYHYITGKFLTDLWKGSTTTKVVTVVNTLGGNKFYIDGVETPNIQLTEGNTYFFDQSAGTNTGFPLRISTAQDGVHIQNGTEFLTGIRYQGTPGDGQPGTGTYLQVQPDSPNLYYYCSLYSGYGGAAALSTITNTAALPSHTTSDIIDATHHSPIVAWAKDGYPIYGPIGYDEPGSTSTLARMVSRYSLRSQRTGTQYSPLTYTWGVTADDNLDYDFTGQSTGSDVSITANVGDNLVFNVNAQYSTGGGGGSTPQTYNFVVTASGASSYTISGTDRNGNVNGANPTITIEEGDTVNFTVSAAGHPFYLKWAQGTGTGNTVGNGGGANTATNNGTTSGTISWVTTSGDAATYYYNCEYHGAMTGNIVVNSSGGGGGTTITHPFWIQKVPAPYNPAQTVAAVVNNGNYQATVLWNTSTAAAGTYYYVCEAHQEMTGTITLTEPVGYAPNTNTYPLGAFTQDFFLETGENNIYAEKIHLDRHNGRFCITPEFPGGTYAYFMTFGPTGGPVFPYVLGDTFYGEVVAYGDAASTNPVFEQPASAGVSIGTQTGVVDAITVDTGGVGYTTCAVSFTGGGGSGAQASSNISVLDGYISGLTVTDGGSGYTTAPTVSIGAPNVAGGVQGTAVASIAITAGNPNSIGTSSLDHNLNWRGGTDYGHSTTEPVSIPLRSVKPYGLSTTGVYLYHYSNETGPTPGWTFSDVTNPNLTGADTYGGYPNAQNIYGYNSSKLLEAYQYSGVRTASTYIANTYFDLGYQTITYTVTVGAKTDGSGGSVANEDFGSGSANCYFLTNSLNVTAQQPALAMTKGNTYIFNQDSATNDTHPLYFSTTDDGVHAGGVKYNEGVTYRLNGVAVDAVTYTSSFDSATTRSVTITVPLDAPQYIHYVCNNHTKMGDYIETNTNVQGDYRRHVDGHSKILGIAFDGYPIYGPYGYLDEMDSASSVVRLKTGYMLKLEGRTPDQFATRPSVISYPYKSFVEDFEYAGNETDALTTTFTVSVSTAVTSGSGNRYYISGGGLDGTQEKPSFNFRKGRKYIFNLSDASLTTHAMLFSTYGDGGAQGWHVSGQNAQDVNVVYTGGVVYKLEDVVVDYAAYVAGFDTATLRSVEITPPIDCPQSLFYFCYNHGNMGERIITGDLDKRNGRYCKTPDYPNGTYAYFITEDDNGDPAFPYILNDSFKSDPIFPGETAYESDSFVYEVGGVEFNVLQTAHHQVTAIDNTLKTIQITANAASFTANQNEIGGNHLKIANLKGTHQGLDGVQKWIDEDPTNNKLYFQTEQQELAGAGEGSVITYLPLDRGTDHNHSNEPVTRGVISPYIDFLGTWYTSAGALGTYNLGESVNLQLGISFLRTYANETIVDRAYGISADGPFTTAGLTFDTATGVFSGTLVNEETLDLTLTVTELISGLSQQYTIQLTNVTTTTSDLAMVYDALSRNIDYTSVYSVHGQPNDNTIWANESWYSRPMYYKSLSCMFTQSQFDNDKFDYVPFWQIAGDKGGGTQWYNLNELAAASSSGYEAYDWFEDNVENRNTFYSYVERYEDVTGREMGFAHLVLNKWWRFAGAFFRCRMRYRLTFTLEAIGNDYQVRVNNGGSTVFEVPKGAFYRFDVSDSSWTGKALEMRLGPTGLPNTDNLRSYGTPGTAGAYYEVYLPESYGLASYYFGQSGGTTFASQHLDLTTTYTAIDTSTVQLTVSNLPVLPAQPILDMYSGANSITATLFSANTEYGGETHYPNTIPYITAGKDPKSGRFPVQLTCTDQNIEYIWFSKTFTYDTTTGNKAFNWKSQFDTYPDYIPLSSPYFRSRVDARNDVNVDYSPVEGGNGVYVGNYISTTEEFPLRNDYGGYGIEVPIQNPSSLVPPKDNSGNVLRSTDIPCNGIPSGVNEPYSFQLYLYNGTYSSLSNEVSVIANPPQLGMWWYEYANGWNGTVSNGYLQHDAGFVDTSLTCGDYFGNILTRSFVIDVAGAPLSALPYIDINTLQVQDYYKGAQNFTVVDNQTQDVQVSYTIDAGTFTWRLRIVNEFPYMETTDGGTRTIFTLNNPTHANGPTVVNTGDFSTYTGQLAAATGLLRECPFRGDTSINMPVDFSIKNDIQPAIFPARGTQKVYTLWVELVESPFDLVDLINLVAVADPCQDHTYDFAYTQNGACVTPSNDYFCNFIKPLRDRNHPEQPIIGMDGIAQIKVTDGITPRTLDFQVPAPWPILYSYLGDCNPTCS